MSGRHKRVSVWAMAGAISQGQWIKIAARAAALEAVVLLGMFFAARYHPHSRPLDAIAIGLAVIAAGAIGIAWRWPFAAVGIALASVMVYHWRGYAPAAIDIALMVMLFNAAAPSRLRPALLLGGLTVAGYLAVGLLSPSGLSIDGLVLGTLAVIASLGLGFAVAGQRAYTRSRREEETQRRVTEERLRIARELHDVVSHSISTINVQAGVAAHVIEQQPEQARQALVTIKETSKQTLQELRGILQVLRQVDDVEPRAPAPTLAQLDTLVEAANRAGVPTTTSIVGSVRPLPPAIDLAAYRVVQESLTNVVRHAGRASAEVTISYEPSRILIGIDDDGNVSFEAGKAESGHGIAGMRERVAATGGGMEAGPRAGRGFSVRAWFPINGARP
jgi:signal transduction histidine kinase